MTMQQAKETMAWRKYINKKKITYTRAVPVGYTYSCSVSFVNYTHGINYDHANCENNLADAEAYGGVFWIRLIHIGSIVPKLGLRDCHNLLFSKKKKNIS